MEIQETKIKGCFLINCQRYHDQRGFFQQLFSSSDDASVQCNWQQSNFSQSQAGVVRGIHLAPFRKLVTCITGQIYDVVVDLRKESETYLKWQGFWLDSQQPQQVLIPANCGHGFFVQEPAAVIYFQDDTYVPGKESEWHWKGFGINWPESKTYILSQKDNTAANWN